MRGKSYAPWQGGEVRWNSLRVEKHGERRCNSLYVESRAPLSRGRDRVDVALHGKSKIHVKQYNHAKQDLLHLSALLRNAQLSTRSQVHSPLPSGGAQLSTQSKYHPTFPPAFPRETRSTPSPSPCQGTYDVRLSTRNDKMNIFIQTLL